MTIGELKNILSHFTNDENQITFRFDIGKNHYDISLSEVDENQNFIDIISRSEKKEINSYTTIE